MILLRLIAAATLGLVVTAGCSTQRDVGAPTPAVSVDLEKPSDGYPSQVVNGTTEEESTASVPLPAREAPNPAPAGTDAASYESTASSESNDSTAHGAHVSPIDAALGFITDVDELKRYLENAVEVHADLLNTCMIESGWDDFRFEAMRPYSESEFVATSYGRTEEEMRQFGYGPVHNAAASIEQVSALVDRAASPPPTNPGAARSEAEQRARNGDIGYCTDFAAENAPKLPNRLPLPVQEIVYEFRVSLAQSAPTQQVWQEWSECMTTSGHRYLDRKAIAQDFEQRTSPIQLALTSAGSQLPSQELLAELRAQIDEIQAAESVVVDIDVACSAEVMLDDRIGEIVYEAEMEFVEAQGDRLLAAADS